MLHSLSIRDVVLVDRLDLEFSASLSALTGETGAGKSILLDALGLALGSRGDSGLVRAGAAQASVSAGFEIAARHPARALLDEQGLAAENPLVLRRVLGADGRSRAFVNDQPVSVGLLRRLGETLVEIHGQFENQGLLDPATHRAALDEYAGLADTAAEVAARHAAWRDCRTAEERAEDEARAARNDEDFLRHALAELDGLAPKPGEETELAQRRAMLGAREKLVEALNAALGELGHGKGPAGALRAAERLLARMAPQALGKLDPAIAALDRAASAVADAVAEVEALGHTLDLDASGLEAAEERLFALRALARKHRVEVDGLLALRG
ncbi:MAG: AAA family ATPase, partial [Rhodospirillales bacterium]|nr:AAA family ATPase [Rhodospirillales bacterium]